MHRSKNGPMRANAWIQRACRAGVALLLAWAALALAAPMADPTDLATIYNATVARRLAVPPEEVLHYGLLADVALAESSAAVDTPQYLLVVDRHALVQTALLLWRESAGRYRLIGASPVSTGKPGSFDHFETPLGVFDHSPANPDFRAEGTLNANGIRGYGVKGMRVFDLGGQRVAKGWGDGAVIDMRLQMHATDPDVLEQRLGTRQSKGCIRIPATLNWLLDMYGVLDSEYERLVEAGRTPRVLYEDRVPISGAGRYVVVVDSHREARPQWARSAPASRAQRLPPASRS
jgi:hypothetical protein